MWAELCLVFFICLNRISKCDVNVKRSDGTGDHLMQFLLHQMTRFGNDLDKINEAQSKYERKVDKLSEAKTKYNTQLTNLQIQINKAIRKASSSKLGCQSGIIGQHVPSPKWPLQVYTHFNPPFVNTPAITYGVYVLDSSHNKNLRLATKVSNMSKKGFSITIQPWSDTVLYGARLSWMACPRSL